jgi:hypothetical protein
MVVKIILLAAEGTMFHVMFLIVKKSVAAMTIYNLRFLGRFYVEYANREHLIYLLTILYHK